MVQTRQCDFCGTDIEPGTGTMFVFVDGRVVHYCSSKCEKNADLGRVPRDVEWTAEGQRLRQRSQRTIGAQEDVEEVAAEPPEESESFADDIDTVPGESDAEAVAATRDAGSDSEGATATSSDDPESTGRDIDDEEIEEVVGRRAGGDDPDIEEDADPDFEDTDAEATVEDTDEDGSEEGQEDQQEASQ